LLGRDHGFTGELGSSDSATAIPLKFDLRCRFRRRVHIERSWAPLEARSRPVPASVAATATVADGKVVLESSAETPACEVRVVLLGLTGDA